MSMNPLKPAERVPSSDRLEEPLNNTLQQSSSNVENLETITSEAVLEENERSMGANVLLISS